MEVPEISEGIVTIMAAAREAGIRAKIAVASNDSDIDPVGACVGMKGSRVQNVVQELKGEKIDIISWHVDQAKYVCNALAPAEVSRVIIDETNRSMEVIVPDEFLSIAIGKRGLNVRLASKLTGWHLDVLSEQRYSETMKEGYDSLVALPGVGTGMADALYEAGFFSAEEVSEASIEDLTQIKGIGESKAGILIEAADAYLALPVQDESEEAIYEEDEPVQEEDAPTPDDNETASEAAGEPDVSELASTDEDPQPSTESDPQE
jgi:N utilization substance protein A